MDDFSAAGALCISATVIAGFFFNLYFDVKALQPESCNWVQPFATIVSKNTSTHLHVVASILSLMG